MTQIQKKAEKMKTYKWRSNEWKNKEEWAEIDAHNMSDAAEKACKQIHDLDSDINDQDLTVATFSLGRIKRFFVSADYGISFHAMELAT